jgi:tetratricopeptide (TPR) repeat protein
MEPFQPISPRSRNKSRIPLIYSSIVPFRMLIHLGTVIPRFLRNHRSSCAVRWIRCSFLLLGICILQSPPLLAQATPQPSVQELYQEAQKAMAAGDYERAIRQYKRLLQMNSRSAELHFHLGLAYYQKEDYEEASRALGQAVELKSDFLVAEAFKGLSDSVMGRFKNSLPLLEKTYRSKAGGLEPELKRLVGIRLGKDYADSGRYLDAESVYGSLLKEYPHDADLLYQSFWLHMTQARTTMQKLLAEAPGSYRTHEMLGHLMKRKENYPAAAEQFRLALKANPAAVGLHYEIGSVLLRTEDRDAKEQARLEFEAELKLHPFHAQSHYQLAEILLAEQKVEDAAESYRHALKFRPHYADAKVGLCKIALSRNKSEAALGECQQAVKMEPLNKSAHYVLGKIYLALGRKDEAKAELTLFQQLKQKADEEEIQLRNAQMGPLEN